MNVPPSRPQAKFKHAHHCGVVGLYRPETAGAFLIALLDHVAAPETMRIEGSYRGTLSVVFYDNQVSGLMVMTDAGGAFKSGWRLNVQQLHHVLTAGTL